VGPEKVLKVYDSDIVIEGVLDYLRGLGFLIRD
jgi:hypothetical protein